MCCKTCQFQSACGISCNRICLFSEWQFLNLISKTFAYKIVWYRKVFLIITHQPPGTSLLLLQGYLESIASKFTFLYFGFSDLERVKERLREEREREREREIEREREKERERERRRLIWRRKFSEKYLPLTFSLLKL